MIGESTVVTRGNWLTDKTAILTEAAQGIGRASSSSRVQLVRRVHCYQFEQSDSGSVVVDALIDDA